jgi:hypothetical protein
MVSKKKIIKPVTPTEEEFNAQNFKGEEWPITQSMLNDALFFRSIIQNEFLTKIRFLRVILK